jgi:MFS family permease
MGIGALFAVVISARLREKVPANILMAACAVAYGSAALAVAWLTFAQALPMLMLSGMAWLITLTELNAAAQLALPQWVRARGLSVYLLVFTGSLALGSYVFGLVATETGLDHALVWSAVLLGAAALSVTVLPFLPLPEGVSLGISTAWPTPVMVFEPCPHDGPVLVTTRYRVPAENLDAFVLAMSAVRRSRLRTGGHSWELYHSPEDPQFLLERFTVLSWTDFQRQHTERWLDYDHEAVEKARRYTVDNASSHQYYIAVRVPK